MHSVWRQWYRIHRVLIEFDSVQEKKIEKCHLMTHNRGGHSVAKLSEGEHDHDIVWKQ